jgi:hypothetical protein
VLERKDHRCHHPDDRSPNRLDSLPDARNRTGWHLPAQLSSKAAAATVRGASRANRRPLRVVLLLRQVMHRSMPNQQLHRSILLLHASNLHHAACFYFEARPSLLDFALVCVTHVSARSRAFPICLKSRPLSLQPPRNLSDPSLNFLLPNFLPAHLHENLPAVENSIHTIYRDEYASFLPHL